MAGGAAVETRQGQQVVITELLSRPAYFFLLPGSHAGRPAPLTKGARERETGKGNLQAKLFVPLGIERRVLHGCGPDELGRQGSVQAVRGGAHGAPAAPGSMAGRRRAAAHGGSRG